MAYKKPFVRHRLFTLTDPGSRIQCITIMAERNVMLRMVVVSAEFSMQKSSALPLAGAAGGLWKVREKPCNAEERQ